MGPESSHPEARHSTTGKDAGLRTIIFRTRGAWKIIQEGQKSYECTEGPDCFVDYSVISLIGPVEVFMQDAGNKLTYGEPTRPPGRHHLTKEM